MRQVLQPFFQAPQYSLEDDDRRWRLATTLARMTRHHSARSDEYGRMVERLHSAWDEGLTDWPDGSAFARAPAEALGQLPYLPVNLFKRLDLHSVPDDEIYRVLHSSGTTGQVPSRIILDKETAALQRRALVSVMQSFLGKARIAMLVVDSRSTLRDRGPLSARAAGIAGMMNFGRDHTFLLNNRMRLQEDELRAFLSRHQDEPILIFGFTFMVWQHLYRALADSQEKIDLSRATLIHSGGWKKLRAESISNEDFKAHLSDRFGLTRVHNFYGMVEQVGAVYVECEAGSFHASSFSEVLVRDPVTRELCDVGEKGVLQTLSVLPWSYPGHSLLTGDLATVEGDGECRCGRRGTRFRVHGRIPRVELRGCSDVYAASMEAGA